MLVAKLQQELECARLAEDQARLDVHSSKKRLDVLRGESSLTSSLLAKRITDLEQQEREQVHSTLLPVRAFEEQSCRCQLEHHLAVNVDCRF